MKKILPPPLATIKANGITFRVKFGKQFAPDWNERFARAQKAFDLECLRLCNDNYVPWLTGQNLAASGVRCSKIGEGQLIWDAPMAGHLYYHPEYSFTQTHPLAGGQWGDRMKADNLDHLAQFAAAQLGG